MLQKQEAITIFVDSSIPLKQTKDIMLNLPFKDNHIDGYINDMLTNILALRRLFPRGTIHKKSNR